MITAPFFGGGIFFEGEYALERAIPFTVNLNGRDYPVDLKEYRHNGIAKFRDGVTTSGEPNDQLFDSQGAWWRYRFSWHHGAGQTIADLDQDADAARYFESRGVDPWDKYQACLLPSTELVLAAAADAISIIATSLHVYVADGAGVKRSADLSTWSSVTGLSGTVLDMDTDGINVYVATTTGVFTVGSTLAATATSTAVPSNGGFHSIAFVGNRLLASDGAEIGELTPTSFDVFYEHFQAAFRWTAMFQVGSRIYVGGYAGNRSELFSVTTTTAGALALSAEASTFFSGELLRAALSYGGTVILCTSKGVRFATLAQDATLQYGPLIEDAGDSLCVTAEGRFAWFGWDDFPDAGCGLGRLALDEFVAPLQPPYATDIFTEDENDPVVAVTRFNGRTIFAIAGEGVYASSTTEHVEFGYLDSGQITFGTVEQKSMSQVKVGFAPLDDDESVRVSVRDENDVSLGTLITTAEGRDEMTLDLDGEETNRASVRIELRGDGTSTPCLRQWRMRGYPIAPPVEEWLVPLIIQSSVVVNDGEGQVLSMSPWDEVERIREVWVDASVVLYREGDHAVRVRVDNFQISTNDWRDGSDWFEVTCTVRLLST